MIMVRLKTLIVFPVAALLTCSSAFCQGGFGEADANADGKVSASELEKYVSGKLQGFARFKELMKELDKDNDGSISENEFADRMRVVQSLISGETSNADDKADDGKKPKARESRPSLKVGDIAPTFKLKSLDGKSETDLADFKHKKPVVLIFGSYT